MAAGGPKKTRPRELPPLLQQGQRTLPTMSSQDSAGDAPKQKKKKLRKESTVDDMDDQGLEMGGLGSRRASEAGDQLTLEHPTDTPSQRRKRKKKAATDLDNDQAELVNGETVEQNTDGEEVVKKRKKKKKPKAAESQLPDELAVEEDDIVADAPITAPVPQQFLFSASQGQSQPVAKVFVERNKHFQPAERSNWRKSHQQMDNVADQQHLHSEWTTRDVSVRVHEGFRVLGLYCQGFLAGYAVWNIVVVYFLSGHQLTSLSNLLEQYHGLAYPSQSLLYLLLAISSVAAFDRVNLAKGWMALREFITLDPVALASFLYFSALVLSLSQQMTSDRMNLYRAYNTTLWPPGSEHQILHPWVTVNLVVALLVGLSWIFIATRPDTDYTQGYLMSMEIEPPKGDKSEMTA